MSIGIYLVFFICFIVITGIRIVQQYQTGVVFQLGKYSRTLKPGLNLIIPLVETAMIIDMRVMTIDIPKQLAITKDNVPVTINGVVYFQVIDAQSAVIKVQNYLYAVSQYAQCALRDVVGGISFDDLLSERKKIGDDIEVIIQKQAANWGLNVSAIKILDVDVPKELKEMMSRQASAEREKRATITKAEGDRLASVNLAAAAKIMAESPGAMQLRTLQTIDGLGPSASNTVILGVPIDILESFRGLTAKLTEKN